MWSTRFASPPTRNPVGRGCLVVMNDTIFNARDVTKNSTYRVEAFESRDLGPLGFADADGKVFITTSPLESIRRKPSSTYEPCDRCRGWMSFSPTSMPME